MCLLLQSDSGPATILERLYSGNLNSYFPYHESFSLLTAYSAVVNKLAFCSGYQNRVLTHLSKPCGCNYNNRLRFLRSSVTCLLSRGARFVISVISLLELNGLQTIHTYMCMAMQLTERLNGVLQWVLIDGYCSRNWHLWFVVDIKLYRVYSRLFYLHF